MKTTENQHPYETAQRTAYRKAKEVNTLLEDFNPSHLVHSILSKEIERMEKRDLHSWSKAKIRKRIEKVFQYGCDDLRESLVQFGQSMLKIKQLKDRKETLPMNPDWMNG